MDGDASVRESCSAAGSDQILLLTTPISILKSMRIKKSIDIFTHWTICVRDWCYELARDSGQQNSYFYGATRRQEWTEYREQQGKSIKEHAIGRMAASYPHETIDEVASLVWKKTLQEKYKIDEKNCQVFVLLLIELIGSQHAKEEFPDALDRWMRKAGRVWYIAHSAIVGSSALLSLGSILRGHSTNQDYTNLNNAMIGFNTTMSMRTTRKKQEKEIKEGQKAIREEMRTKGIPLIEPEANT